MKTVVTPEMRSAVGRVAIREVSYPISASDIRRWAIAIYWPEPPPQRFVDSSQSTIIAPQELNPFAWAVHTREPDPRSFGLRDDEVILSDSAERLLGVSPPELPNGLFGGFSVEYGVPMSVGDVITSETSLAGYSERESSLGHMLIMTLEDRWVNQRDELVKRCERRILRY